MKRIILSTAIICLILVSFTACFSSNNSDDSDYVDVGNDDFVDNADDLGDVAADADDDFGNDVVLDDNEDYKDDNNVPDGVLELKTFSQCYFMDYICDEIDDETDDEFFGLAFKKADDIIKKLDGSQTIAIYTSYDTVRFVPVVSEARYTVVFDFADRINYETGKINVDSFPEKLFHTLSNVSLNGLTDPGHPIEECNGVPLDEFISENGKQYFVNTGYLDPHLFLDAEKNETFTFGGYIGTQWTEADVKADIEYYEIDGAITIDSEPTQNGYFTLDCSDLAPGLYYVVEFDTFVEMM